MNHKLLTGLMFASMQQLSNAIANAIATTIKSHQD